MFQALLSKRMMETFFLKKIIIATILKKDERYKNWEETKDTMN